MASPANQTARRKGHNQIFQQKPALLSQIPNRQPSKLEIQLTLTKQRPSQFLIANFGAIFSFYTTLFSPLNPSLGVAHD